MPPLLPKTIAVRRRCPCFDSPKNLLSHICPAAAFADTIFDSRSGCVFSNPCLHGQKLLVSCHATPEKRDFNPNETLTGRLGSVNDAQKLPRAPSFGKGANTAAEAEVAK